MTILMILTLATQDDKTQRQKIAELRKQLDSGDKVAAVQELGGIYDDDARALIVPQLASTTEAVRKAALEALAGQRHPSSVKGIAGLISAENKNQAVVKECVTALGRLDMCACIPVLVPLLDAFDHDLAPEVLKILAKIGCPEAIPGLLDLLKDIESAESQPNLPRLGRALGAPGANPPPKAAGAPKRMGRNQNKITALGPEVRAILGQITGRGFVKHKEWESWYAGAAMSLASEYMCAAVRKTFDVEIGTPKACPNEKKSHNDIFLKHKRDAAPAAKGK